MLILFQISLLVNIELFTCCTDPSVVAAIVTLHQSVVPLEIHKSCIYESPMHDRFIGKRTDMTLFIVVIIFIFWHSAWLKSFLKMAPGDKIDMVSSVNLALYFDNATQNSFYADCTLFFSFGSRRYTFAAYIPKNVKRD